MKPEVKVVNETIITKETISVIKTPEINSNSTISANETKTITVITPFKE